MLMVLRALAVGLFALAATVQVGRTAAVAAFWELRPDLLTGIWPGHPDVLRSVAMAEVGDAAGRGQLPSQQTLQQLEQLARAAPLAAEPLLVHGAMALRAGDYRKAERLLIQARDRQPRSPAARYLLTDLYLRTGQSAAALAEISVLGRLIPGGTRQLAPALAAYADSPGAVAELKQIVSRYPELTEPLLSELAAKPENAEMILAIAEGSRPATEPSPWQEKLVTGLVQRGDYSRAYSVWARLAGVRQPKARGLFNPGFGQSSAPPPFNWRFASSAGGVAEPGGNGLRVLYFGREDAVLASQLLLLSSGRYRLEMSVAGQTGENEIAWMLTCLPSKRQILKLPMNQGKGPTLSGEFSVPGEGCAAQRLELRGVGTEFPQSADFRLSGLSLRRVGG